MLRSRQRRSRPPTATSRVLHPSRSWWLDPIAFYQTAKTQVLRLREAGGRELVTLAKDAA